MYNVYFDEPDSRLAVIQRLTPWFGSSEHVRGQTLKDPYAR